MMDRYSYVLIASLVICSVFSLPITSQAQQNEKDFPISLEVQIYPTGSIINVSTALIRINASQSINFRVAYNFVDRTNAGVHDLEEGGGPGVGVEYRYWLQNFLQGTFFALRSDFWWLNIDWEDRLLTGSQITSGSSKVTVWQPTVQVGYDLLENDPFWHFSPSLAFGYEINIVTDGESVGEGPILLGGFSLTRYF